MLGDVGTPREVGVEHAARVLDRARVVEHEAEAAAVLHVAAREVVAEDQQPPVVDDGHLPVVALQVVVGPGDGDPHLAQPLLEVAEALLVAAARVGHQGAHGDPALGRLLQRLSDPAMVQAEDVEVQPPARAIDRLQQGSGSVLGLDEQSRHVISSPS